MVKVTAMVAHHQQVTHMVLVRLILERVSAQFCSTTTLYTKPLLTIRESSLKNHCAVKTHHIEHKTLVLCDRKQIGIGFRTPSTSFFSAYPSSSSWVWPYGAQCASQKQLLCCIVFQMNTILHCISIRQTSNEEKQHTGRTCHTHTHTYIFRQKIMQPPHPHK